jgi:hypothetical protein
MEKTLSVEAIRAVTNTLDLVENMTGEKYAIIGGALFKILGIPRYNTPDVDVAATGDVNDDEILTPVDNPNSFSWNENGHFSVGGVKVDWIHKLSDGTSRLFDLAVKHREIRDGFKCAPLKYAVAIRIAACRDKDIRLYKSFARRGLIREVEIFNLLKRNAPKSKGYQWLKARLQPS